MSKRTQSVLAICPFYKSEDAHRILCEGLCRDNSIHMAFGTPAGRRSWAGRYCRSWDYEHCPLAGMQEARYEEG